MVYLISEASDLTNLNITFGPPPNEEVDSYRLYITETEQSAVVVDVCNFFIFVKCLFFLSFAIWIISTVNVGFVRSYCFEFISCFVDAKFDK